MYTGVILLCTADMWCYTVVSQSSFFESRAECDAAIVELVKDPEFDTLYRFAEDGTVYDVHDKVCINWDAKDI